MSAQTVSPGVRRFIIIVDRIAIFISRHWLLMANVALFVFVALPVLAPILMEYGYTGPAQLIYTAYKLTCHQLAHPPYFFFGEQPVYTLDQLRATIPYNDQDIFFWNNFIGNGQMGYKMAWCERDTAIYGSIFLGGLLFGLLRPRIRPLDWRIYLVMITPMALDGFTQLFGLRESDYLLRGITGALFGLGSVWLIYPYLEEAMRDVYAQTTAQFQRAVMHDT